MRHYGVSDLEPVLERFGVDFRYIEGPSYVGPPLAVNADGSSKVRPQRVRVESRSHGTS